VVRRIRFTRSQMQRAKRLLHMKYKPSEIAEEIRCDVQSVYKTYIPAGCPHERDERGYLWIVGDQFRDWMVILQRDAVADGRVKLEEGQGYCVMCERAVDLQEVFEVKLVSPSLELVKGYCPECGAVVSRGRERGNHGDLQTELS
jgi:hypothetical protein